MVRLSNASREPAVAFAKAMRETHRICRCVQLLLVLPLAPGPEPVHVQGAGRAGYKFIFITLCASHAATYATWNAMEELVRDEEQAQWMLEKAKVGHPTESHHVMARGLLLPGAQKKYIPGTEDRIKSSAGFDDHRCINQRSGERRASIQDGALCAVGALIV